MAEMSNYLENALINGTIRGTSFTAPTTVYVALYITDPTDADVGTEVTGGSYARQPVTFAAPVNGASASNADVNFPLATAPFGTVSFIGLRDAVTGGNLLYHSPLDVAKTIETGDIFKISTGNLTVTLA